VTPLLAQQPRAQRSFERMYKRHVGDVYRYSLAVLRNQSDAEDVTQTTFLNAYRAFERGERPRDPHNWLITIAHNVCRQRFRQSQRRVAEVAYDDGIAEAVVPDDDAPSAEDIRRALDQLAFNQRAALVMRELEDRSYAEIAELLEVSVSAVETLLFRARRALREQLEASLTCRAAELAVSRQLDRRLPRKEQGALRAHLRACKACAALARKQRAQRAAIKALGAVPLPASLASFFGGGAAAASATTGGAALGGGLAAKAAAVAAAGVVVAGAYELGREPSPSSAPATPVAKPSLSAVAGPQAPAAAGAALPPAHARTARAPGRAPDRIVELPTAIPAHAAARGPGGSPPAPARPPHAGEQGPPPHAGEQGLPPHAKARGAARSGPPKAAQAPPGRARPRPAPPAQARARRAAERPGPAVRATPVRPAQRPPASGRSPEPARGRGGMVAPAPSLPVEPPVTGGASSGGLVAPPPPLSLPVQPPATG
jgi:RNA polymerase sigma-70 factor, ECF subfamily